MAFAKEVKATFPVVQDKDAPIHEKFGVGALPSNVLLDRAGKVTYIQEGVELPKLEAAIKKAVASGAVKKTAAPKKPAKKTPARKK